MSGRRGAGVPVAAVAAEQQPSELDKQWDKFAPGINKIFRTRPTADISKPIMDNGEWMTHYT